MELFVAYKRIIVQRWEFKTGNNIIFSYAHYHIVKFILFQVYVIFIIIAL